MIGIPPPHMRPAQSGAEYTVLHGLRAAVDALSKYTDNQIEKKNSGDGTKLLNRCRVICITSARDNESMKRLEEIFLTVLTQQNKLAAGNDR